MKISEKPISTTFIPPQTDNDSIAISKLSNIIDRFFYEVNSEILINPSKIFKKSKEDTSLKKDCQQSVENLKQLTEEIEQPSEKLQDLIDVISVQILLNKDLKYHLFLYETCSCLLEEGKIEEGLKFILKHGSDLEFDPVLQLTDLLFSNLLKKPHDLIFLNSLVNELFYLLINKINSNQLTDSVIVKKLEEIIESYFQLYAENYVDSFETLVNQFNELGQLINKNHPLSPESIQRFANKGLLSSWITGLRAALDEEKNATDPLFSLLLKVLKNTSQSDFWLQVVQTDPHVIPESQKQALVLTFLEHSSNLQFSELLQLLHQMLPGLLNKSDDLICLNLAIDKIICLFIDKIDFKYLKNKNAARQFEEVFQYCFQISLENDLNSFELILNKFNDFTFSINRKELCFSPESIQDCANKKLISAWMAGLRAPLNEEKNAADPLFSLLLKSLKRTFLLDFWLQVVQTDLLVIPNSQKEALVLTFLEHGSNLEFNQIIQVLEKTIPNLLDKSNDSIPSKFTMDKFIRLLVNKIDCKKLKIKTCADKFVKIIQMYFELFPEKGQEDIKKLDAVVHECFKICVMNNINLFKSLKREFNYLVPLINKISPKFNVESLQNIANKELTSAWIAGLLASSKKNENYNDPFFPLILQFITSTFQMDFWLQIIEIDPHIIPGFQKKELILAFLRNQSHFDDFQIRAVEKELFMWVPLVPGLIQKCIAEENVNLRLYKIALDEFCEKDEEDDLSWIYLNVFINLILEFKNEKNNLREKWEALKLKCLQNWVYRFHKKFEKAPHSESAMYYCKNIHFLSQNFSKQAEAIHLATAAVELWLDVKEVEESSQNAIFEIIKSFSQDSKMLWCFLKQLLNGVFRAKFPIEFLNNVKKYVTFCIQLPQGLEFKNLILCDYFAKNKVLAKKIEYNQQDEQSWNKLYEKIGNDQYPMQSLNNMMLEQAAKNKFFAKELSKKADFKVDDVQTLKRDFHIFSKFRQCSVALYKKEFEIRGKFTPWMQREHRFIHNVFSASLAQLLHHGFSHLQQSPEFSNPVADWMSVCKDILYSLKTNHPAKDDFLFIWEVFYTGCCSLSSLIQVMLNSLPPVKLDVKNKDAQEIEDQAKKVDDIMGDFLNYFNGLIALLIDLDLPERLDLTRLKKIFLEIVEGFQNPYKNQIQCYYLGILFEKKIPEKGGSQQILKWIKEIRKLKEFQENISKWHPMISRQIKIIFNEDSENLIKGLIALGPKPEPE